MKKKWQIMMAILAVETAFCLSTQPVSAQEASTETDVETAVRTFDGEIENSVFEEKTIDETPVYCYQPSQMYTSLTSMLNRFYYYPDQPISSIDDAWKAISNNGLVQLAEENKAVVIVLSPVDGNAYSEADYNLWLDLSKKLSSTPKGEESFMSYGSPLFNKTFMTGEGSGADFITKYLAGDQVASGMIAGTLVVNGTKTPEENFYAVPSYLVNCSDTVVDFYKGINGADAEEEVNGNEDYYNSTYVMDSGYTPKRVIVSSKSADALDAEVLEDAWNSLFCRIYRQLLDHDAFTEGVESAVVMDRPYYKDMNIEFTSEEFPSAPGTLYEWIPQEAMDTMNNGTDETYPLIVVCHGNGDNPIFEAESNGWVQLADDENVIVVAGEEIWSPGFPPESGVPRYGELNADWIRNYVCKKFPVDMSRVYIAGFSIGGFETADTSAADPTLFAAAAAMAYPADGNMEIWPYDYYEHDYTSEDYDLPMMYMAGRKDGGNTMPKPGSGEQDHTVMSTQLFFNQILSFNEMDDDLIDLKDFDYDLYPGENDQEGYDDWDGTAAEYICQDLDFDKYPFYGWNVKATPNSVQDEMTTSEGITYTRNIFKNSDSFNMLEFLTMGDMGHNHYNRYAKIIWTDFFSRFTRNPDTGVLSFDGVEASK